jgi:hypothetical protein
MYAPVESDAPANRPAELAWVAARPRPLRANENDIFNGMSEVYVRRYSSAHVLSRGRWGDRRTRGPQ